MADGSLMESDDFFALQMRRAGNVLIAATPEVTPPDLFATNALALGDISTEKDSDGILRRAEAFRILPPLASAFPASCGGSGISASTWARRNSRRAKSFCRKPARTNAIEIPVDAENNFELADFVGDKLPPGMRTARPKRSPTSASGTWASSSPRRN